MGTQNYSVASARNISCQGCKMQMLFWWWHILLNPRMIQFLNEHNLERKDYAEYAGTQDSIGNAEDSSCSHIYIYPSSYCSQGNLLVSADSYVLMTVNRCWLYQHGGGEVVRGLREYIWMIRSVTLSSKVQLFITGSLCCTRSGYF